MCKHVRRIQNSDFELRSSFVNRHSSFLDAAIDLSLTKALYCAYVSCREHMRQRAFSGLFEPEKSENNGATQGDHRHGFQHPPTFYGRSTLGLVTPARQIRLACHGLSDLAAAD